VVVLVVAQKWGLLISQAEQEQQDKDMLAGRQQAVLAVLVAVALAELEQQVEQLQMLVITQIPAMAEMADLDCHLQRQAHYNGMQAVVVVVATVQLLDLGVKAALAVVAMAEIPHWTACVA
jgi:hypothetical protein